VPVEEGVGGAGAVHPQQHSATGPEPRLVAGQLPQCGLDDVEVVLGGVRAGVPGPQHHLQRFPGPGSSMVDEHTQRVEPEPPFERRLGVLLLRMGPDLGGVHIQDQRLLGVAAVIGCVLTGQPPDGGPGCSPGRVDRLQRRIDVAGQHIDRA
jgi:hypothetical protein